MNNLKSILRGWPLLVIACALSAWVVLVAPEKLGLLGWGIAKLTGGAYCGYWVDRIMFPYARPHQLEGIERGTAWKRRAWLVSAAILAFGLIP